MRSFTRVKILDGTDDICPVEDFLSTQFTIRRTSPLRTEFLFYNDKGVTWTPIETEETTNETNHSRKEYL